jgi:hypothetical protein
VQMYTYMLWTSSSCISPALILCSMDAPSHASCRGFFVYQQCAGWVMCEEDATWGGGADACRGGCLAHKTLCRKGSTSSGFTAGKSLAAGRGHPETRGWARGSGWRVCVSPTGRGWRQAGGCSEAPLYWYDHRRRTAMHCRAAPRGEGGQQQGVGGVRTQCERGAAGTWGKGRGGAWAPAI